MNTNETLAVSRADLYELTLNTMHNDRVTRGDSGASIFIDSETVAGNAIYARGADLRALFTTVSDAVARVPTLFLCGFGF